MYGPRYASSSARIVHLYDMTVAEAPSIFSTQMLSSASNGPVKTSLADVSGPIVNWTCGEPGFAPHADALGGTPTPPGMFNAGSYGSWRNSGGIRIRIWPRAVANSGQCDVCRGGTRHGALRRRTSQAESETKFERVLSLDLEFEDVQATDATTTSQRIRIKRYLTPQFCCERF